LDLGRDISVQQMITEEKEDTAGRSHSLKNEEEEPAKRRGSRDGKKGEPTKRADNLGASEDGPEQGSAAAPTTKREKKLGNKRLMATVPLGLRQEIPTSSLSTRCHAVSLTKECQNRLLLFSFSDFDLISRSFSGWKSRTASRCLRVQ
jgi:hypothetical protein